MERTFQRLTQQQRYLSDWIACSTSLASLPSDARLTDNTEDGDDEASNAPSPRHSRTPILNRAARGLMSPQDMTISSVASLVSVGKPPLHGTDPVSEDDTAVQSPCSNDSSKDQLAQRKKSPKSRSILSPHVFSHTSDLSQSEDEGHLPALKSDRMSETLLSIRQSYTKGNRGVLPSIQSPPLISVSRCSTQSQSLLKGAQQSWIRASPSLAKSTRSLATISDVSIAAKSKKAWNEKAKPKQPSSKATISDGIRKKLAPAKHRSPVRHRSPSLVTAEEVLQMVSEPKAVKRHPPSVMSVPETDGTLQRKKKAALKRQPLALSTARAGISGECCKHARR